MNIKISSQKQPANVNFKGFEHKKSEYGTNEYKFNYPHDYNKYDCYLEVYSLNKDQSSNFSIKERLTNSETGSKQVKIGKDGIAIDMDFAYDELGVNEPFAYRYKLVDKNNPTKFFYKTETGSIISKDNDRYNVVTQNGSKVNKGGAMTLALPDSYAVGWVYDKNGKPVLDKELLEKGKNSTRTFSNKLGGTLAGFEAKIDELKEAGYTRLVTTPIFTDDSLSSHSYWNKNCMQMSSGLGNINNYASFQKSLFKAGINFVSDGAFVNEGLEGIHFKNVLKWGEKSPFYNWFRASGLQSGPLSMGIFAKNQQYISHKVVNAPHLYTQDVDGQIKTAKNPDYDPKKPTYVQIFDNRLVSEESKNDTKNLIKTYDKTDTGNPLEINHHNDTVIPYSFEILPETYDNNVKNLNQYNKKAPEAIKLDSPLAAKFLTTSESYVLEDKYENGFETWDANTDIAKLNFVFSHADTKRLENLPKHERDFQLEQIQAKNFEAQDYVVSSGIYWTKKTQNILNEYVAKTLQNPNLDTQKVFGQIMKAVQDGDLPQNIKEKVTPSVVQNVLEGTYQTKIESRTSNAKELVLESVMDLPLDSIEFADDTASVLASSYITNRATKSELVGKSRYELSKMNNPQLTKETAKIYNKTNEMFTNDIAKFATEILGDANLNLKDKLFDGDRVTNYGKYVLPLLGQDIAKFAIIKSLVPNAKVNVNEQGEIAYDYEALKENTNLAQLGILGDSPEDEANLLVNKIQKGISHINAADKKVLVNSILNRLEGTNEKSFALAEMITDRTNAGLDWRIDAAKDIADMDALRNSNSNFKDSWSKVIDFWTKFSNGVLKENQNSYLVAEITDEWGLHDKSGKFSTPKDAVMKLHQDTGMTSIANYSYFFTDVANIFNKDITTGKATDANARATKIYDKMVGADNYLNSAPLDSILYSYTFVGNHDKPRMLHCLALDMELFHTDFSKNTHHQKLAASVLKNKNYNEISNQDLKNIDFNLVSNKAIAMADAVKAGFGKALCEVYEPSKKKDEVFAAISDAISDLAQGKYLGKSFQADAFGTKAFDKVLDLVLNQAEKEHGLKLTREEKSKIFNKSFETILKPGMTKFKNMMGFLVGLPGNPTMYAGDEIGMTGYEEKCKNVYIQNRSFLHWEWLDDENKKFIKDFKNDMTKAMQLRARPEMEALNTGTPYTLALHRDQNQGAPVSVIFRQTADGKMALSLFNANNINLDKDAKMNPPHLKLDSISFHTDNNDKLGLSGGLVAGTTFKNANPQDKSVYKVCENGGNYFIKRFDSEQDYRTFLLNGSNYSENNKIDMFDSSLILYSVDDKAEVSFKGKSLYNPQYNIISNPYQPQPVLAEKGTQLKIVAR